MTNIKLNTRTSHPLLHVDRPTERYFEIAIDTERTDSNHTRPPLNVAIVLDRSGSMSGEKIVRAKQAAEYILTRLTERDRVAVVVYDNEIDVVAESAYATSEHILRCRNRLSEIPARNMTNLFDGWLQGCDQVANIRDTAFVSRVLLLTDGLANVGTTDPSEIARHAGALFERGISTSTFGIGTDFDEDLLSRMADAGGGRFYYIAYSGLIPEAFREELGDLVSVVARNATLRVTTPTDGRIRVLGGIPHEASHESLVVSIGDLYAGEHRPYYFGLQTDGGVLDSKLTIQSTLTAISTNEAEIELGKSIEFRFAGADVVNDQPVDEEVMRSVADVAIADARLEAIRLNKQRHFREANALFARTVSQHASFRDTLAMTEDETFAAKLGSTLDPWELKMRQAEAYRKARRRERSSRNEER